MRVAIVTADWPAFSGGGIAAITHTLAAGLAPQVELEVWTRGGGSRSRALASSADPFVVLGLPGRSWRRRGSAHWRRGLPRQLDRFRPDVLIASTWEPLVGMDRGLLPERCRTFAHGREITAALSPERAKQRSEQLASGGRWWVLTRWMREQRAAGGVPEQDVAVVPAAIPSPSSPERPARPARRLLTVGRLIPRKGHDRVLDALARLAPTHPELHYDVVGEGPHAGALAQQVEALGLGSRVTLHGHLPERELEARWAAADLFVLPARTEADGDTEGYGLVYLEAGARGLAVLGSGCGGTGEAVRAGETGWLSDDDPESLARTLETALSDLAELRRRGVQGRARFERCGQPEHLAAAALADLERL